MELDERKLKEIYGIDLEDFRSNLRGIGYNLHLMNRSENFRNENQFLKLEDDYQKAVEAYSGIKDFRVNGDLKFIEFYGDKLSELREEIDSFKEGVLSRNEFSPSKIERLLYTDLKKIF